MGGQGVGGIEGVVVFVSIGIGVEAKGCREQLAGFEGFENNGGDGGVRTETTRFAIARHGSSFSSIGMEGRGPRFITTSHAVMHGCV